MTEPPPQPERRAAPPAKIFLKQPRMLRVCYALVPVLGAGIYFFGWRVGALVGVCTVFGVLTERLTTRQRNAPVSMAVFVTCGLYSLSLPPTMPFWQAVVGVVVAVLFGKEVFGGFGRNWANPAIVGRAFVYVCFPASMTGRFVPAFDAWPGGLTHWSFVTSGLGESLSAAGRALNAVTSATPIIAARDHGYIAPYGQLVLGNIHGIFEASWGPSALAAGSIGEVCSVLLILSGLYLMITGTSNWRLTVATLLGAVAANTLFLLLIAPGDGRFWHHWAVDGVGRLSAVPFTLLAGSLLYGAVFMVTDPVSAPKKTPAMWAYGLTIGILIVLIKWRGQFPGSLSFSILLGNMVSPLLDQAATALSRRGKAAPAGREAAP